MSNDKPIYLDDAKIQWFRLYLQTWAKKHFRQFPWRDTKNPYSILVAEFLLQKTNAALVLPIYQAFIKKYPTVKDLAKADHQDLQKFLQPLGLSFRAQRLYQTANAIVENYDGNIPSDEAQLLKLPGVGKYTARSVCANAFGQSKALIDTNVARIFERFFSLQGGKVKSRCPILWQAAETVSPISDVGTWNLTLFDFGAAVCTAKNPHCLECPISQKCNFFLTCT
jgi:A/G-specific adenine glycosylase